jgi:hypothetical protein
MSYPDPGSVVRQLSEAASRDSGSQIYTILDAARHEYIYMAIVQFIHQCRCLYGDRIPEVLAKASPYLVSLQPGDDFTNWLISKGWGNSWGIFLESTASSEELRRHFRELLRAKTETGRELFFRYYDPRVFRAYLPTCNEVETGIFFGPVHSFLLEDEDANILLKYSRGHAGPICESISLS